MTARPYATGLVLATAAFFGGQALLPQDADLTARVVALEAQNKVQAAAIAQLQADSSRRDLLVARHEGWLLRLPAHLRRFAATTDKAREEGFTHAGANIGAKETLLAALKGLARDLEVGTAPMKDADHDR